MRSASAASTSGFAIGPSWARIGTPSRRGSRWKWRWNTVWPAGASLNCISVSPSASSAATAARPTRCTRGMSADSTAGSASSSVRDGALAMTRTWPSTWGMTSMKARHTSSS